MSFGICQAHNCRVQVKGNKFMCKKHWHMVPHELKVPFYRAERAALRKQQITPELRAAVGDCVRAVIEMESERQPA